MSAIEEMYEKYGLDKRPMITQDIFPEIYTSYPPFTAEKQLELIKFLGGLQIEILKIKNEFILGRVGEGIEGRSKKFSVALARFVNRFYEEISEKQRQEIKEILER